MTGRKREHMAEAGLLLTAILWGGGFVAGKMALTGANPFAVLFWRFGIAALFCFCVFYKRIIRADRHLIFRAFVISAVQVLSLCLQLTGLQYTTSAKQSFLCTAYVAIVPFLSWAVLRKRPEGKAFVSGVLALCGIGLISLNGFGGISRGDVLSILFSLGFGVQIVLISVFMRDDMDGAAFTFFQILGSAVLSLSFCIISGRSVTVRGSEALVGTGYLAVLNTFAAFMLQNVCQKHARDTTAALLLSMESVFGFVFSILYYNESLSVKFVLGCALCLAAIIINSVSFRKKGGNAA